MRHSVAILLLLALVATTVQAQVNVRLRGETDNGAGKRVELMAYVDMLTWEEELLDETVIDSAGRFELGCYLRYPRLVVVQVEDYSQSFYAEPGRTYEVYLPTFRWEQDEERNIFLDPVALPLQFLHIPPDELNLRMLRMNDTIDSFLVREQVHLDPRFKPSRRWMDSLEAVVAPQYTVGGDSFFDRWVRFRLADMRYSMGFGSRKQMMNRYIFDRSILYHDESYMHFLLGLLEKMVSTGTRKLPKWQLVEWVYEGKRETYLDSIGTDALLRDEQLRELAALVALKESYFDIDYERQSVRRMVQEISITSKFEEHRQLAERLLGLMKRDEAGRKMPTFDLPDADGNRVQLDSLAGKWIYLAFVRVNDPNCVRELETMAFFHDSIVAKHPDVAFVSVSCDREFQKMYHFLRNSKHGSRYNWTWVHFDGDYRLLERFGVASYPHFVLINPQGQQEYNVTPAPESGLLMRGPWEREQE